MIDDLIRNTRSFRSFTTKEISLDTIHSMLECGRLGGSSKNIQGINYIIILSKEKVLDIFPHTAWAGAIKWSPSLEERPRAYIAMCSSTDVPLPEKLLYFNMGIASQNIMLKARELGFGGCLLGAFNKVEVSRLIELPKDSYEIELLIALGEPMESINLIDTVEDLTSYYRDEDNIHYVPKKTLNKLILKTI